MEHIKINCENALIEEYYKKNINITINYTSTVNILNDKYFLKNNLSIDKYIEKKGNYIFMYNNEIVMNVFSDNKDLKTQIIKDNNIFISYDSFDLNS